MTKDLGFRPGDEKLFAVIRGLCARLDWVALEHPVEGLDCRNPDVFATARQQIAHKVFDALSEEERFIAAWQYCQAITEGNLQQRLEIGDDAFRNLLTHDAEEAAEMARAAFGGIKTELVQ